MANVDRLALVAFPANLLFNFCDESNVAKLLIFYSVASGLVTPRLLG